MNSWRYIAASLRHFRHIHLAVAAGVAIATAVITGALLVGDSMRGSLRELALSGLGRIDLVLTAEQPFRQELADEWLAAAVLRARGAEGSPLILSQGSAAFRDAAGQTRRAANLQIIGAPAAFWSLAATKGSLPVREGDEVALAADVASELGVREGDTVLVRLPVAEGIPADSALGEKEELAAARRLTVSAILDEDDPSTLVRFSLRPSQQAPRNAFVPLPTLQEMLKLPGKANAIAVASSVSGRDAPLNGATYNDARSGGLSPTLADYGLKIERIALGQNERHAYLRASADRLVLPPYVVETLKDITKGLPYPPSAAATDTQPAVAYLANRIAAGERTVPYSTVAGVDSTAALGPLFDGGGKPLELGPDEAAINDWTAEQLGIGVGDSISLTWYVPETTHGRLVEAKPLTLKVRAVVPLTDSSGAPTEAADPAFAPDLPGVTDQKSIDDWDLPFELVEQVRPVDEEYWDKYRTTPKVFVSHELAARLWSSRWGTDSVVRLPIADGRSAATLGQALQDALAPAAMGVNLLPVRDDALQAAAGTTPFDGLFLGFSFFLMASAVMLTALLFRLGAEQRAAEVGLLMAIGVSAARLRRWLLAEAAVVAAAGALVGAALGVGYGRVLVYGLNTWWVEATAAPFMRLFVTPRSLLVGFAAGLAAALAAVAWSLRRLGRLPVRQLLAGDAQPPLAAKGSSRWTTALLPAMCMAAAVGLGLAARNWQGENRSIAFMGGGALVLVALLLAVRGMLRQPQPRRPASLTLGGLAARNARRNPGRTMLSLALAATASFLIVALSAFRLAPTDEGIGGFDLLGTADLPILFDLSTAEGRRELGFSDADSELLTDATIIGFRVNEGDDASCLNLYKPAQPRVLGAPAALAAASRFAFSAVRDQGEDSGDAESPRSPWELLHGGGGSGNPPTFPAILDGNTATYSLHLTGLGDHIVVTSSAQQGATLEVVALLSNSVLQGDVLVGEEDFGSLFPEEAGRRFFLIRRGAGSPPLEKLASLLETQLEDYGFDAVDARERLGELLAVQNTYLSTFQSLGALGLLLGVVGLAVAQLRSVLERRGELALLQATGFPRRRLAAMVLAENLVLLAGGVGMGCVAALAAVAPQAIVQQAGVPWATLALLIGVVAMGGALAAWVASRVVLRAALLPALRGE
jgi:ABC-type antimicrobial peptide transport system permease subunit